MTDLIEFTIKPRLSCEHTEAIKLIPVRNKPGIFKTICTICDTCFADNGDDIEKQLKEFGTKLAASQVDLDPEFAKVLNDNFWELCSND